MHQSIPAVPIPPRATVGHLLRCQSRGWGIRNFIAATGLGNRELKVAEHSFSARFC